MVRVKVCGITNLEDALLAVRLGADALGFVFAASPRQINSDIAAEITSALPPFVSKVGVFVNEAVEKVSHIAAQCGLDTLQFHGKEMPSYCEPFEQKIIKAFQIKDKKSLASMSNYSVDAYLLDTYVEGRLGGTGKTFDWSLAKQAKEYGLIILSGGLNPENVAQAIREVEPYAVDVASGVEKEFGKKDPDKLKRFFEEVQKASG